MVTTIFVAILSNPKFGPFGQMTTKNLEHKN
jgi:hypothetical protein